MTDTNPSIGVRKRLWLLALIATVLALLVCGYLYMFRGKDYRGVEALAHLQPIPESDWFLIAKVDVNEILAEAHYRANMIALFVCLAIVLAGVTTTLVYRQRQSRLFRELYEAERQRRAIKEELRTAFYSIGDAVMTTDNRGHVRQVNPVAERLTGWTEAEAFGRPLRDVFRIVNEQTRDQVESPVDRVLREGKIVGLANHTLLIAKDGSERPIADSGAPIRTDEGEITGVVLVFRDQTEERAAENALRANERRLRRFYESGLLGVIFWNIRGQILDANDKFLEMVGYTRADLTSGQIDWLNMTPPEYGRLDEDSVAELKATGVNKMPFEKEYLRKDGTRIPISVAGAMLDEERTNGVAFVLDITERKRAENALREQEVLYRSLFDSMLNGFAHCRMVFEQGRPVDFIYLNVNGAFEAQTGLKNVAGRKVSEVIPGIRESSRDLFEVYGRVALTGKPETFESYVEALDMWFSISVYSPKREHFVAVFDVITERKRTEDALRKSEARLGFGLQTIQTGAWSLDLRDHTAERTLLHDRIFGYEALLPSWTFETFLEHVLAEDRAEVEQAFREATTKQTDWNFECRIRRVDGELRWIRAAGRHERNAEGKPVRMSGIVQDITERKAVEEGVRNLNLELEQRVRDRTVELETTNAELEAFSYSVSHDLRAPLRAIAGFARILVDDYGPQLDDEGRRVCSVIDENTGRMSQLIDDLLTFSRLGRTQMQPSLIDMQGMARAVFYEVTTPEQRSRIDFELQTIPPVVGDPSLMRQVWANLLGNAMKFSSKRERAAITVSGATQEGESVFAIGDNGAGFDMQYVNKLFGVFQRLHSSKQFEGTGVGLALVQRVIRRHGGRVWADGEIDRGATFHFALPLKGT